MLRQVVQHGELCYEFPSLSAVRARSLRSLASLREEHKRMVNPDIYWVGLSDALFALRRELLSRSEVSAT
jgi:nicotinate phosphoribosyltransferase